LQTRTSHTLGQATIVTLTAILG